MARAKKDTPVTENTTPAVETAVAAEAPVTMPKSLTEKLNAAKALVAKYEREIASERIKNDIQVGDDITFNFGRGDKQRSLKGVVTATKEIEEGTMKGLNLLVTSGEGFDAEVYKVHVRDVTENPKGDERRVKVEGEAEKVAEGDADPLDNAE